MILIVRQVSESKGPWFLRIGKTMNCIEWPVYFSLAAAWWPVFSRFEVKLCLKLRISLFKWWCGVRDNSPRLHIFRLSDAWFEEGFPHRSCHWRRKRILRKWGTTEMDERRKAIQRQNFNFFFFEYRISVHSFTPLSPSIVETRCPSIA